jgi:hypothetical protein
MPPTSDPLPSPEPVIAPASMSLQPATSQQSTVTIAAHPATITLYRHHQHRRRGNELKHTAATRASSRALVLAKKRQIPQVNGCFNTATNATMDDNHAFCSRNTSPCLHTSPAGDTSSSCTFVGGLAVISGYAATRGYAAKFSPSHLPSRRHLQQLHLRQRPRRHPRLRRHPWLCRLSLQFLQHLKCQPGYLPIRSMFSVSNVVIIATILDFTVALSAIFILSNDTLI